MKSIKYSITLLAVMVGFLSQASGLLINATNDLIHVNIGTKPAENREAISNPTGYKVVEAHYPAVFRLGLGAGKRGSLFVKRGEHTSLIPIPDESHLKINHIVLKMVNGHLNAVVYGFGQDNQARQMTYEVSPNSKTIIGSISYSTGVARGLQNWY